jgi:fructan beta-fructosidase
MRILYFTFVLLCCHIAAAQPGNPAGKDSLASRGMDEPYRPQFHFTPPAHWMNDPNGMVYSNGLYHLFYQHYPDSTVWGPMHWGHAVSPDMIHWKHLPVALFPDSLGYIFSGSAVTDSQNTSGLGTLQHPPLVAVFTYHDPAGEKKGSRDFQTQGLAFSTDNGITWKKYAHNPVLRNPGQRDFRDPKIVWHEASQKWIMVLAVGDHVQFYASPDLIHWSFLSDFGKNAGAHGGVWECPDMFSMKVEGTEEKKWSLLVSINPGGPNGGSATQYFTGTFDGTRFMNESREIHWVDWGKDDYAGVTWSGNRDGRRLFLGWMSNWQYAGVVPTEKWRSAMTIPRELKLVRKNETFSLVTIPAKEMEALRSGAFLQMENVPLKDGEVFAITNPGFQQAEILVDIRLTDHSTDSIVLTLENEKHEKITFGYSAKNHHVFVDRRFSGQTDFSPAFPGIAVAPYVAENNLKFHLFCDASSIELFVDDGNLVMSSLVFPTEKFSLLNLKTAGGTAMLEKLTAIKLKSSWTDIHDPGH